ncbi:hypothetical protein GQ457_05G022870 [Hibiscus cannabinus]
MHSFGLSGDAVGPFRVWDLGVSPKIQCFLWFVLLELPTLVMLHARGVQVGAISMACVFCGIGCDEIRHILYDCSMARDVWDGFFRWWRVACVRPQLLGAMVVVPVGLLVPGSGEGDGDGRIIALFSGPLGILDSNVAEIRAIVAALDILVARKWDGVSFFVIESDSTMALSWILHKERRPWRLGRWFRDIDGACLVLSCVCFNHVLREANALADVLAKCGVDISD